MLFLMEKSMNKLIYKIFHKRAMYLYADNHFIKKVWINKEENPINKRYSIKCIFKKYILGSHYSRIVVEPKLVKIATEEEIHLESELVRGERVGK